MCRFIALVAFVPVFLPSACAQWEVYNNLPERFTIRVWSDKTPGRVGKATVPPGGTRTVPLSQDRHRIQLESGGGNIYLLKPTQLSDKPRTDLKTILTPKEKRNGRWVYQYMNQEGFDESDYAEAIRELSRSSWQTTYLAIDGQARVDARVDFRGGTGIYAAGALRGQLTDIRYRPSRNEGDYIIDGSWRAANVGGNFLFEVTGDGRLVGHYTHNGQRFDWNGNRR